MGFLIRTAITAVAFYIAANVVTGFYFPSLGNLIVAAIIFGVVNAVIRPAFASLSLPPSSIVMGVVTLVVNAVLLGLTALLMPGMRVTSLGTALLATLIIWLVSWGANKVIGERGAGTPA